jgi:hypothetical protein
MEENEIDFGGLLEKVGRFQNITELKGEDLRFIYDLIFVGFDEGCIEEGIEFPYTKRQLSKKINLLGEEMGEIFAEFQKGMTSDIEEPDQKKTQAKPKTGKGKLAKAV